MILCENNSMRHSWPDSWSEFHLNCYLTAAHSMVSQITVLVELCGLTRWSWTFLRGFRCQRTQGTPLELEKKKKQLNYFLFHRRAIYSSRFASKLKIKITKKIWKNWYDHPIPKFPDKWMVNKKKTNSYRLCTNHLHPWSSIQFI